MNRVANCSVRNIILVEKCLPPWFYVPPGTLYVRIFLLRTLQHAVYEGMPFFYQYDIPTGFLISHIKMKFVGNTILNYSH